METFPASWMIITTPFISNSPALFIEGSPLINDNYFATTDPSQKVAFGRAVIKRYGRSTGYHRGKGNLALRMARLPNNVRKEERHGKTP